MSVCDPSENAALPSWLTPLATAKIVVTVPMQEWAAGLANDLSIPVNSVRTAWFDGHPIAAWINCHTYTIVNGVEVPGAYHGAALYLITDPAQYPASPVVAPPERIHWGVVGATGVALGAVVGAFFLALAHAGRASTAPTLRKGVRGSTARRS